VAGLRGRDPEEERQALPKILTELTADEVRALGERYLEGARATAAASRSSSTRCRTTATWG
jgi:hypothetical protein